MEVGRGDVEVVAIEVCEDWVVFTFTLAVFSCLALVVAKATSEQ